MNQGEILNEEHAEAIREFWRSEPFKGLCDFSPLLKRRRVDRNPRPIFNSSLLPDFLKESKHSDYKIDYDINPDGMARVKLIRRGEEIVGSILLQDLDIESAFASHFNVEKGLRGMGLGKLIMSRAIFKAKQSGCKSITLQVFCTNYGAIRLYKKLGFFICMRIWHPEGWMYTMTKQI